jgi:hypothetical protein
MEILMRYRFNLKDATVFSDVTVQLNSILDFFSLQKMVELFLKGIHATIKREVYYWHGYYVSLIYHISGLRALPQ